MLTPTPCRTSLLGYICRKIPHRVLLMVEAQTTKLKQPFIEPPEPPHILSVLTDTDNFWMERFSIIPSFILASSWGTAYHYNLVPRHVRHETINYYRNSPVKIELEEICLAPRPRLICMTSDCSRSRTTRRSLPLCCQI